MNLFKSLLNVLIFNNNNSEKTLKNLFLLNNNHNDISSLRKSYISYYYSLSPKISRNIEISHLWGIILKDWFKLKK